jgi:hypothetical protein
MKAKTLVAALVVCLAGAAICLAADNPQLGTWKLNEAKSKLAPGAVKVTLVVYTADGDSIKVAIDEIGADGKALHNDWMGKFDGKDYAVTGDPTADMRSYRQVNDHTLAYSNKKGGKVVLSGRVVVAADGKSRTVTFNATDSMGMKTTSTAVYDKQ